MSVVDKLPAELWLLIASYLDLEQLGGFPSSRSAARPDHVRLNLTCRALSKIALQSMFKYLDFEKLDQEVTPISDQRIGLGSLRFYDRLGLLMKTWQQNADTVQFVQEVNYRATYIYNHAFKAFVDLLSHGNSLTSLNMIDCLPDNLDTLAAAFERPDSFPKLRTCSIRTSYNISDAGRFTAAIIRKPSLSVVCLDLAVWRMADLESDKCYRSESETALGMLEKCSLSLTMRGSFTTMLRFLFRERGTRSVVLGNEPYGLAPLHHKQMFVATREHMDLDEVQHLQSGLELGSEQLERLEICTPTSQRCMLHSNLDFSTFHALRYLLAPVSVFRTLSEGETLTALLPPSLETLHTIFEFDFDADTVSYLTVRASADHLITIEKLQHRLEHVRALVPLVIPWIGQILEKSPDILPHLRCFKAQEIHVLIRSEDENFFDILDLSQFFPNWCTVPELTASVRLRVPVSWGPQRLLIVPD